jgi:hypothetical protein
VRRIDCNASHPVLIPLRTDCKTFLRMAELPRLVPLQEPVPHVVLREQ